MAVRYTMVQDDMVEISENIVSKRIVSIETLLIELGKKLSEIQRTKEEYNQLVDILHGINECPDINITMPDIPEKLK